MRDSLAKIDVGAELNTEWVGRSYVFSPSVDSTNSRLKERLAHEDATQLPHGTVLVTDYQATGRGRMARRWEAPAGSSILVSILLRPDWPAERAMWLTMVAGLAVVDAISAETGLDVSLKWPNDVVAEQDGVWHKLCGMLVEGDLDGRGRLATSIVGIGINVNISAEALPESATPASSLLLLTGQPVARRGLLLALLSAFEKRYAAAAAGSSPHAAWNERLMTVGNAVRVTAAGQTNPLVGMAIGTTPDGQLLVESADGLVHSVMVGDVTLR